jgi:hypothetical protein
MKNIKAANDSIKIIDFKEYLDNSKKFIKLKDAEFKLVPKI